MENLEEILSQKFGDKYSNLKTLEIVYSKPQNTCTISFLYPENVESLTENDKTELREYIENLFSINAKIQLKFKKSYLNENLIKNSIITYFQKNHKSLATVLKEQNIVVEKNVFDVALTLTIPEQILQNLNIGEIEQGLIAYLNTQYIAQFSCKFLNGENLDNETIENEIQASLKTQIKKEKPLARYKVFGQVKIFGKDITPEPEYLSNIRGSKLSVILAGKISHFTKKTYKRKRQEKEVEKTYYKFLLHEENRFLHVVYFCPQANIAKMDKIVDGTEVLVIVDIKKEANGLNGYLRSLSLCEINQEVFRHNKEKITDYQIVFPQKYHVMRQGNIFDREKHFDDNITNNTFVVFDVETTGLEADNCEIIEIGAVKVSGGEIIERFQSLVHPKESISEEITGITGITNEMVSDAPSIEWVIKDFYLFTKGTILSGYNVNFDMKFIQNAGKPYGVKFDNEVQDVLPLARQKVSAKNYHLGTVVKTLNLTLDNAHRALFDALATAQVLLELSKID